MYTLCIHIQELTTYYLLILTTTSCLLLNTWPVVCVPSAREKWCNPWFFRKPAHTSMSFSSKMIASLKTPSCERRSFAKANRFVWSYVVKVCRNKGKKRCWQDVKKFIGLLHSAPSRFIGQTWKQCQLTYFLYECWLALYNQKIRHSTCHFFLLLFALIITSGKSRNSPFELGVHSNRSLVLKSDCEIQ